MAVLSETTRRVEIPHEKDAWIELRDLSPVDQNLCFREAWNRVGMDFLGDEEMRDIQVQFETGVVMLERGIAAWSYEAECNDANKRRLDNETFTWVLRELEGSETEAERKNA